MNSNSSNADTNDTFDIKSTAIDPVTAIVTNRVSSCGLSTTDPNQRYWSNFFKAPFNHFLVETSNEPDAQNIAYCLNSSKAGPGPGEVYEEGNPYEVLSPLSQQQVNQTLWLLRNGYPHTNAATLFEKAGVDSSLPPALTNLDAFTATQLAIWVIERGQENYTLQICDTADPHIKSSRIGATAQYLVNQARRRGNEPPAPPEVNVMKVNHSPFVQDDIYYVGLYQTFSNSGQPTQITVPELSGAFSVNTNLIPQEYFASGSFFYIAIPNWKSVISKCILVRATVTEGAAAYVMFPVNNATGLLQDIGLAMTGRRFATDTFTACVTSLCPPCPTPCPPCPKPCPKPCPPYPGPRPKPCPTPCPPWNSCAPGKHNSLYKPYSHDTQLSDWNHDSQWDQTCRRF